jgi:hypothetical protein
MVYPVTVPHAMLCRTPPAWLDLMAFTGGWPPCDEYRGSSILR